MDDIANKLAQMLEDPEGLSTIKSLAESMMGEGGNSLSSVMSKAGNKVEENSAGMGSMSEMLSGISPDQIGLMMKLMNAFNNQQDDDRTRLLYSLRPYLSSRRQERVDKAAKLLKLAAILPLLNESGLFKL